MSGVKALFSRDKETRNIQINNVFIALFRGGAILCNLYLIPVTLKYLDKDNYGVWLTLTSIISWLAFMDIGLGNGMRNKLAALGQTESKQALKEYVSTTYGIFSIIVLSFFLVFSIINPFLPWNSILKTRMPSHEVLLLSYIVVFSFSVRLILDLASMIVVALHKPFIKAFIEFLFNALTLLFVFALSFFQYKSFIVYGCIVSFVPVLILAVFSIWIFNKRSKYSFLSPSVKHFNKNLLKELFGLGGQFFVIQLAALIVFSTDNILITQLFSPTDVTKFNIAYKYFSIITIAFMIILTPYWSSFTSAYYSNKLDWIKNAFKRLLTVWGIQVFFIALFILLAPLAYTLWLQNSLSIDRSINVWLGVYVAINNWNNLFVYFLNGVSKIRLQLYSSIVIGCLNIPLAYCFAKYTSMGVSAVIVSNCICLLICSVWSPIQCFKIINGTAKGVWNE